MRFFTPELYVRFNSSDDDVANDADEAWERAILEYRNHLDGIRERLPSQIRALAEIDLHDAELLAFDRVVEPALSIPFATLGPITFWSGMTILSIRQNEKILSLFYLLSDRIRQHAPRQNWPFSKRRVHWLYDEIDTDIDQPGMFLHRILLSDGRVLEIPFMSVVMHGVSLEPANENEMSLQSA